jgi:hypothetical protein
MKASRRVNPSMLVEKEKLDTEQIYSLIDKPYYVDKAKYKSE